MILVVGCLKNLINSCTIWFSWSRRIQDPSNFKNKSSLNRNWVLFGVHQKKNLNGSAKENLNMIFDYWLSAAFSGLLRDVPVCWQQMPVCRQQMLLVNKLSCLFFSISCCRHCRQPTGCSRQACRLPLFSKFASFQILLSSPIQFNLHGHYLLLENKAKF